ncbi:MAG TPA: VOC family protein [Solirubrobacteraceae bacterium]|nr:VOC family protein [Solirubrobacteraceae bacterium]
MPLVDHVDLVVSSIERSLPFYRELLGPLGWVGVTEERGERGETIHYLWGPDWGGALGLRERPTEGDESAYDRYAIGLHHLAFEAPSRNAVDAAEEFARRNAELDGEAGERHYTPGYYAVFFFDPDGLKLEVVHRPRPFTLSFMRGLVRGAGSLAARRRRT